MSRDQDAGAALTVQPGRHWPSVGSGALLELFWIPLGAGEKSGLVHASGRAFEAVSARLQRRARCDLFHSALVARHDGQTFAIEQAPAWGAGPGDRGVVATGPVGLRWLGRSALFRYEVRRWAGGVIPDAASAVGGPQRLPTDAERVGRLLALVPSVPAMTWGRDELATGDMWNSNSLVSWLLVSSGHCLDGVRPPDRGQAPGWLAGLVVAQQGPSAGAGRLRRRG